MHPPVQSQRKLKSDVLVLKQRGESGSENLGLVPLSSSCSYLLCPDSSKEEITGSICLMQTLLSQILQTFSCASSLPTEFFLGRVELTSFLNWEFLSVEAKVAKAWWPLLIYPQP